MSKPETPKPVPTFPRRWSWGRITITRYQGGNVWGVDVIPTFIGTTVFVLYAWRFSVALTLNAGPKQ